MCTDALLDQVDVIYDLTVGYSGLEKEDIPYEEYLIENVFFWKYYPREIHINVQQHALHRLPGMDGSWKQAGGKEQDKEEVEAQRKSAFNKWVTQKFVEKDKLMGTFYDNQKFGDGLECAIEPQLDDWAVFGFVIFSSWYTVPFLYGTLKWTLWVLYFISTYRIA